MKKLLLLITLIAVAFIVYYRQRLFLRDPIAKFYADGTQVAGPQIFINYSNDVLVLRPNVEPLLVQNWDHTPGTPPVLPCFRFLACMTPADLATKTPLPSPASAATMTNREITFRDDSGKHIRITLR